MKDITVKFINDHGVNVTLRAQCVLEYVHKLNVCYDNVYKSMSGDMDDVTTYRDDEGVEYFPFYFFAEDVYGEDYEVHAYESYTKGCWVVSHITAYSDDGEQLYEIGGRTQEITIKVE